MGVKHLAVAMAVMTALARPAVAEIAEVNLGAITTAPKGASSQPVERVAIRLDHPLQIEAAQRPPHAWIEVRPATPALAGVTRIAGSHRRAPKRLADTLRFEAVSGLAYGSYFPAGGLERATPASTFAGAPVTSRWTFVSAWPAGASQPAGASRFGASEHLSGTLIAVRASF